MEKLYEAGSKVENFELISSKDVPEQNAVLYEFRHTKCKARLFYLATDDDNKWLSVAFKTIPSDDSGVFHILEHSVLCGSDKYPIREPFGELMRSSMNTFLNAMTFPDKTLYPVGSRNEKDFLNLAGVYLDAVFRPAIYRNPNIFRQEGWHYELDSPSEPAVLNGVVFNEMKGVESSVDSRIYDELMKMLFPDSCYGFVYGGKPSEIPKLTYEDFLKRHKEFYNADNAVFYLEGRMDIRKPVLLMEEYLSDAAKAEPVSDIAIQAPVPACAKSISYPIAPDEECAQRTQIMFGKLLCGFGDKEKTYAAMMLADYLTGSMEAPLTQRILSGQLGQDVRFVVDNSIAQPFFFIQICNTDRDKLELIVREIRAVADELIKTGIDREELEAIINRMDFQCRETEEPRALYHNLAVLNSCLYGCEADTYLQFGDMFAALRRLLDTDYYEKLLAEMLDETGIVTLIAEPSCTLAEEEYLAECSYIKEKQDAWSEDELAKVLSAQQELMTWQQTPDTPEQLETMPRLSLSDVDPLPVRKPTSEAEYNGVKLLIHPAPVSEIAYLNLYFPVPAKYQERLADISLLGNLLMNLPTENYDLLGLNREVKKSIGDLGFEFIVAAAPGETERCRTYFTVRASILKPKLAEAVGLIHEILQNSILDRPEMVYNTLLQLFDSFRNEIIENGHSYGTRKAVSSCSARGGATELLEGIACYENLKALCMDFESKSGEFIRLLEDASKDIFTRDGMIIGLTVPEEDALAPDCIETYRLPTLIDGFRSVAQQDIDMSLRPERENVFVQIPAAVSYASSGLNLSALGERYSGAWAVASKIISLEYLWNAVRVQGGAYGVGLKADSDGDLCFYSYRDPDGCRSFNAYKAASEFLSCYLGSDEELDKFIISSISAGEPLLSPRDTGIAADREYLCGTDYDSLCAIRKQMLALTKEALRTQVGVLEKMWEKAAFCLVGCEKNGFVPDRTIVI